MKIILVVLVVLAIIFVVQMGSAEALSTAVPRTLVP